MHRSQFSCMNWHSETSKIYKEGMKYSIKLHVISRSFLHIAFFWTLLLSQKTFFVICFNKKLNRTMITSSNIWYVYYVHNFRYKHLGFSTCIKYQYIHQFTRFYSPTPSFPSLKKHYNCVAYTICLLKSKIINILRKNVNVTCCSIAKPR